ncbi:mechanosensitive ion channel family protein [Nonomuraea sp. SYSU D8015]|uniref:mechanosensitive ion channel family protein n=1 Tax=Nonomuraea sp. SYSU D8015 TaxID=2593644 RepID=UPI003FA5EB03
MNISQGLTDVWRQIATFVPRLIAFLAILLIGWLVARLIAKATDKILERVGFDRVVERSGVGRMLQRSRYDASSLIAKLLFYAIVLITLQIAFSVFGPNPVSALLNGVVAWLPQAAVAIVIVVVAGAIATAVKDIVGSALAGLSYGRWLATGAAVFIWALGIIAALNQIGVATTVTTPVLITVLATAGAIAAIGIGGGLIQPMQQRWQRWLGRIEQEAPQARAQAAAYQRGRADAARQLAETADPSGPLHASSVGNVPRTASGSTASEVHRRS